jgi:hypothetical protein
MRSLQIIGLGAFCLLGPKAFTLAWNDSGRQLQSDDWRSIQEGIDGYPAGKMLEIAFRRTQEDVLEMFQWRSEFIAMLGVQPGPIVEREWKTLSSWPPMTGAGTWTGMTWWENQQAWHDMANMIFPSPVTGNWLATINTTLCHVRPNDQNFDLRTLAQSGEEVLELGILAFPAEEEAMFRTSLDAYLGQAESMAAETFTFDFFSNGAEYTPLTTAYNANGPPANDGSELWKVYMVVWESLSEYEEGVLALESAMESLKNSTVQEHSSIDVTYRSTSKVCCSSSRQCLLDPEECNVGVLGFQDTWAVSCAQCPQPCTTDYGMCSMLSSKTCFDIGGEVTQSCDAISSDVVAELDSSDGKMEHAFYTMSVVLSLAVGLLPV